MGEEFFERGDKAIRPVCGEESSWDIDSFIFEIRGDEIGVKGEIFIEEIDVEVTGSMVGVVENLVELVVCQSGSIGPVFEMAKGKCFVGKFFPPHFGEIGVGC